MDRPKLIKARSKRAFRLVRDRFGVTERRYRLRDVRQVLRNLLQIRADKRRRMSRQDEPEELCITRQILDRAQLRDVALHLVWIGPNPRLISHKVERIERLGFEEHSRNRRIAGCQHGAVDAPPFARHEELRKRTKEDIREPVSNRSSIFDVSARKASSSTSNLRSIVDSSELSTAPKSGSSEVTPAAEPWICGLTRGQTQGLGIPGRNAQTAHCCFARPAGISR
jgi:hypothetical protein